MTKAQEVLGLASPAQGSRKSKSGSLWIEIIPTHIKMLIRYILLFINEMKRKRAISSGN
jgi:hypothetical protein